MAIKPQALNHQERDLRLENRETVPDEVPANDLRAVRTGIERAKQPATIARAKRLRVNSYKCECFEKGWLAALSEIEGILQP